jgi:hypothetical protein
MLLVRPVSPRPFGRSGRTVRRYLVIEKRYRPRPKIGVRSYVFDDIPTITQPTVMLCAPARIEWDDFEFRDIRAAVAAHYEAQRKLCDAEDGADGDRDALIKAKLEYGRTWDVCQHIAYQVFNAEPQTVRDLFLRSEMLTMHYGAGQLSHFLLESHDPGHRMLGGLLEACWKIGGAANV